MKQNTKLAAIILCTVPLVAAAERVSINDLATKLDAKPEIRFISMVNEPLDGNSDNFQIRVLCSEAFNINSMYITTRDSSTSVDISYNSVSLLNNVFGAGFAPPTSWRVAHTDFSTIAAASSGGHELLSNMNVASLGVGTGGSFDILGSRSPNTQQTMISVGAVVETVNTPENNCRIVLVDF